MISRTICIFVAFAAQTLAQDQCWTKGVTAPTAAPNAYQKCPNSNMCCRTNADDGDRCATSADRAGLCISKNFDIWRESCTDKQWRDGNCLQLCTDPYVRDNGSTLNRSESDWLITPCEDGSLCCGIRGSEEYGDCCRANKGVWLDNFKILSTKPAYGSLSSGFASPTGCPSSSTPRQCSSSNNTGAIVGGVVGGVGGIVAIVLGLWLLLRHRKPNRGARSELQDTGVVPTEKYAMQPGGGLPYHHGPPPGELPSSPAAVELGTI
ncbi:hypothetical protein HBI56_014260 [Parastagonospora nodorum]|uniref:Mid2 domain-containing protein n=2 Tax=Phaeosphaeria nodorum (strain SN15 / ATCC MYA-4574 / FGSC 10173) TaxID=321614 RepID=A0A7U2I230_PHANO|nr:hypothetical protein SNOG_01799 [Parastagonospora nodorum SN15]KAH3915200.1 hypothetical protein HBH56_085720 [Parastagonospora nodorum]EAT91448.1 hypothetical protein SNOG_01799 [Parastagonospora nodorum SN15]KAH3930081.1 hypothetical protein HBH54_116110 [Parastagonospora nodorum]KAH3982261.1 hypothetical protein HBH52_081430 [Parastagonospora nodorum]KAH4040728.1 hypothetical protein HBI09_013110 [Parastagonospora nodorum]